MKKLLFTALVVSSIVAAPALASDPKSGANNPTADHNNPSSCVGAERATQNSNGGVRDRGAFGRDQAAAVAWINSGAYLYISYGDFLKAWKAECTSGLGG